MIDITIFNAELSTQKYITSTCNCIRLWLIFTIFNAELSTQKYITSPFICIILCSDFPTAFLGHRPQSQCEKGSFSPISWGKIPNSVVIKLFVKIGNKIFFNEIKNQTFTRLWPGYCLFWLCKGNTTHTIPGTSAVYLHL